MIPVTSIDGGGMQVIPPLHLELQTGMMAHGTVPWTKLKS